MCDQLRFLFQFMCIFYIPPFLLFSFMHRPYKYFRVDWNFYFRIEEFQARNILSPFKQMSRLKGFVLRDAH